MSALYSEIILDHFRQPRNFGNLPSPDVTCEEVNPLCGDRIRIELALREGIIIESRFYGDGCAISIAAASLLTGLIAGASIAPDDEIISNQQLLSSLESEIKPSRRKCALLALDALRAGIKNYKSSK
jgi:nitrogen fixation NifU-like protein